MKKVLLAVLAIALMAAPAFASVQNIKVSGDIETTYLNRENFDLGGSTATYDQSVFLMQTRLRVDSDLTDKVAATIALINEREWGASTTTTGVDLNLAYVTMKEMLYSPLTVTLGRQNFAFGNSFVIDSAGTNNSAPADSGLNSIAEDLTKQTAQDAIRLTFDYNPLTIDVVYSKITQGVVSGTIEDDDTDLIGMNASYQFDDEKATLVEGYLWVKNDKPAALGAGDDNAKTDRVYMPGVRSSMNILDGWNLQGEFAYQTGTKYLGAAGEHASRKAYAAQVISSHALKFEKTAKYKPVFAMSYTMYSGDTNGAPGDERYSAWDPMYENQAGGKIYNTLFNASNCHIVGASLSMVPAEDVMAQLYFDHLFLDKEVGAFALNQPDGSTSTPTQKGNESLGNEVGMVVTYDYTEDVQLGARAGWFFPGSRYGNDKKNDSASQVLLNAKVSF